ncbi:MAG TPA: 4-hydroxyphenylacetate 3-hydroxylase N-terminal domain-containing protein [Stellaceae bacterium]|jgi:4-hydroxyphenylacetate 3-monooxygenase|nr:4-hydroxyphenylacetate 3-hydroxylase N-terminal domain-containing protein [Stellaceae bacterium]
MRTGAEYREALRDGRVVYVMGEGRVDDVTTHPATRAVVEEYVRWHDLHRDPKWAETLIGPGGVPWALTAPKTGADLIGMGRSFAKTCFLSAGNITHDPAYGNLIAMGIVNAVCEHGAGAEHVARADKYRAMIAETGRFLTFSSGSALIGYRMRPDPATRAAINVVRETDKGVVLSGRIGMHTSPCYAEDIYVGALCGAQLDGHPLSFVVEVAAPGVTILCRKVAAREQNPFIAPLSSRFDELDGTLWLDDVLIPWEHVFLTDQNLEPVARWLLWHHLYGWGARAEFSLGLALALADAMGLKENEATVEYLIDLVAAVQTIRACQLAAAHEPEPTATGFCGPNHRHVMAGGITLFKARQRISEILRIIPGSSLVVAPADTDLAAPELSIGLEEAFAGGGYTAAQRAALLQLAWDHVSSGLDGRESAFELHASGGMPTWRGRLRKSFADYNALAKAVLRQIDGDMPAIDLSSIAAASLAPRRVNAPRPAPAGDKR